MKVNTKPKYQSVSITYDPNGRNPNVLFHLKGDWSVEDTGVPGIGASGSFEFEMARNPLNKRFEKPRKLELNGIINDNIPEEERHALAKAIKCDLKDHIIAMLETVNGDIRRAVHGIW
jgi:hypothetical protein